ncbi:Gfo/Idh/MocA family protein [Echinicola rosea]|uniref:NADH-dependent dehydrogenase n=1 Tax=Echinicola rosea TaxID=1807691 RepID=A0ABQ1V5A8_9BACT|nr:Gfo/Idh/MocA family oxidoreductase [Echinicola rosea]GGF36464.1 NADH-dependent dehydrogenase [Echinicola rosea]
MKDNKAEIRTKNAGRRDFLKSSLIALGGIAIVPRHVLGKGYVAPSDKINLGFIGLGKQSRGLIGAFAKQENAQIVAGSDVWTTKMDWFKQHASASYKNAGREISANALQTYSDYRELLASDSIDGVVIATPDHWHALNAIDAMKAGKDVYCEKPLTLTINEGKEMVDMAKKYDSIVQTGSMQRSWDSFRKACELVRNGYLGEIKQVLVQVGSPSRPYDLQKEPLPSEVDWNQWCGPAPMLAYNHRLAPPDNDVKFWPDWRLFDETGGGILCDWGAHMFDIAQWALGMDSSGPVQYVPPAGETSPQTGLKMIYDNGVEMVHHDFGRGYGVRFIGTEGKMDISRNYFEPTPAHLKDIELKPTDVKLYNTDGGHHKNWLDCMQSREKPICDVEIGHRSATICNIANIAYRLNRPLDWNPRKEKFKKDKEANSMMGYEYRKFQQ